MAEPREIIVRQATSNDVNAITYIIRKVEWLPQLKGEPPSVTSGRVAEIIETCDAEQGHEMLVAQFADSGEVAGYISIHWLPYAILRGLEGFISELFVKESCRGMGVGAKLVEAAKELARQNNCSRLSLLNGRNRPSYERGFYKKCGFTERDEMANFIFILPEK